MIDKEPNVYSFNDECYVYFGDYKKLQTENQQLKEKINQYENPDDLTLFYMWLDEKAKDKMKQLQSTLEEIREYINNYDVFKEFSFPLMKREEENQVKSSIEYEFNTSVKKHLLQIIDKGVNNE